MTISHEFECHTPINPEDIIELAPVANTYWQQQHKIKSKTP
jgi:hypothetical protein